MHRCAMRGTDSAIDADRWLYALVTGETIQRFAAIAGFVWLGDANKEQAKWADQPNP